MFDLTPLQPWYLYLFLFLFAVTYMLVRPRQGEQSTRYAGIMLLGVAALAAFFVLENTWLKFGLVLAAIVIMFVGRADEIKPLTPGHQFIWQLVIVVILVTAGWTIPYVTNPWAGGVIPLDWLRVGGWLVPGSFLAAIWLLFFMNSINWLDGVDGLAGSILVIAHAALVALSLLPSTQDSQTLVLALIGAAVLLAFLVWNFSPAQIYLGTTGSWFMGLYVALVAMHGGGKIITTVLVLALPALDAVYVVMRRLWTGRLPWQKDTSSHWHHRLLAAGLRPRSIALAGAAITFTLAATSILVSTPAKLGILAVIVIGFLVAVLGRQQILSTKGNK